MSKILALIFCAAAVFASLSSEAAFDVVPRKPGAKGFVPEVKKTEDEVPAKLDPAKKQVILVCFVLDEAINSDCEKLKAKLKTKCPSAQVTFLKNPPLEKLEALKKLGYPPNTLMMVSSHGALLPDKQHILSVPMGFEGEEKEWGGEIKLTDPDRVISTSVLKTRKLTDAIKRTLISPSVLLSACHSGDACWGTGLCMGAACRANETAFIDNNKDGLEATEREISDLFCDEGKFDKADKNSDGVVNAEELGKHFCKIYGEKDGKACVSAIQDGETREYFPQMHTFALHRSKPKPSPTPGSQPGLEEPMVPATSTDSHAPANP